MTSHALLFEGSYEWALRELPEKIGTESTDVVHVRTARMGIDEVRALIAAAYQTPLQETHRHFVIAPQEFTVEAQNALLKLLEEPPATARFYVVVANREKLLPTLRSRLMSHSKDESDEASPDIRAAQDTFFEASYAGRLEMIADRMTKKDDLWAASIMKGVEEYAAVQENVSLMRAVLELQSMFGMPGASRKMILEHFALILPEKTQVR